MKISLALTSNVLNCRTSLFHKNPRYVGVLRGCHTCAPKFILWAIDINLLFCSRFFPVAKAQLAVKLCLTMSSSSLHPTGKHYFYCAPSSLIRYCSHLRATSASSVDTVSWTGIVHITAPRWGLQCTVFSGVLGPVMWSYLLIRDRQQVDHFSLCFSTLCSKASKSFR